MQMGTGMAGIDRLLNSQNATIPGTSSTGPGSNFMLTPGPFSSVRDQQLRNEMWNNALSGNRNQGTGIGSLIRPAVGITGGLMAGAMLPGAGSLLLGGLRSAMAPRPESAPLLPQRRAQSGVAGGGQPNALQSLILNLLMQRQRQAQMRQQMPQHGLMRPL